MEIPKYFTYKMRFIYSLVFNAVLPLTDFSLEEKGIYLSVSTVAFSLPLYSLVSPLSTNGTCVCVATKVFSVRIA